MSYVNQQNDIHAKASFQQVLDYQLNAYDSHVVALHRANHWEAMSQARPRRVFQPFETRSLGRSVLCWGEAALSAQAAAGSFRKQPGSVLATSNVPQRSTFCNMIRQWCLPLSAFTISSLQTATFAVVKPSKMHVTRISARTGETSQ